MPYLAHLAGLLLTIAVSGVGAWWVRRQTDDRAGTVMVLLLSTHVLIGVCAVAVLSGSSLSPVGLAACLLIYAVVVSNPILWFVFAVYYTGREYWLTKPVWIAIVAGAVLPAGLVLTNPLHELLLVDYRIVSEPIPYLGYRRTGLMSGLIFLTNLPLCVGFGLLLRTLLFSRRNTLWQLLALVGGMAAIIVTAVLTATDIVPLRGFPYGVYGAGVFGILVALALFRTGLFAVAPLARDMLFDSIDDAVLVVDANRRIVDFNETASERFPNVVDRVGDALEDAYPALVSETDAIRAGENGRGAPSERTADSTPFAETIAQPTADGRRTFRVTVHEVASGGEPRGYGLIVRDVSELEAYASDLERKTDQLEQFASALSHDLRNPVAVATGYVELAQETGDQAHFREALGALERIDETIEDLLTLSREGRAIDELETVSLRSVIADAWSTSDTGDGALEIDVDDDVRIRADPSRLRTLFENLFRNAIEHGGETVRVGSLEGGFFVADDGPGVPDDERQTVFERGYSTRADGTGFGLAIVESIATAHGWSIEVTEGRDGGARFEIAGIEREATGEYGTTAGPTRDVPVNGSSE